MGIIRMGIPEDIALYIKETYKINHFVETGTFQGSTSYWASRHFKKVDTIEFSEEIYKKTKKNYEGVNNINFIFGDSRSALREIVTQVNEPILFWLDAHWCSGFSYGKDDQCPLLDELKIIVNSPHEHHILIDDARLFEAPPPLPNLVEEYPALKDLMDVSDNSYFTIFEDVIFILPEQAKKNFCQFLQTKTTEAWNAYGEKLRRQDILRKQTRINKTKCLINDFLKIWNLK